MPCRGGFGFVFGAFLAALMWWFYGLIAALDSMDSFTSASADDPISSVFAEMIAVFTVLGFSRCAVLHKPGKLGINAVEGLVYGAAAQVSGMITGLATVDLVLRNHMRSAGHPQFKKTAGATWREIAVTTAN